MHEILGRDGRVDVPPGVVWMLEAEGDRVQKRPLDGGFLRGRGPVGGVTDHRVSDGRKLRSNLVRHSGEQRNGHQGHSGGRFDGRHSSLRWPAPGRAAPTPRLTAGRDPHPCPVSLVVGEGVAQVMLTGQPAVNQSQVLLLHLATHELPPEIRPRLM